MFLRQNIYREPVFFRTPIVCPRIIEATGRVLQAIGYILEQEKNNRTWTYVAWAGRSQTYPRLNEETKA